MCHVGAGQPCRCHNSGAAHLMLCSKLRCLSPVVLQGQQSACQLQLLRAAGLVAAAGCGGLLSKGYTLNTSVWHNSAGVH